VTFLNYSARLSDSKTKEFCAFVFFARSYRKCHQRPVSRTLLYFLFAWFGILLELVNLGAVETFSDETCLHIHCVRIATLLGL
jgi:hypothetical protein